MTESTEFSTVGHEALTVVDADSPLRGVRLADSGDDRPPRWARPPRPLRREYGNRAPGRGADAHQPDRGDRPQRGDRKPPNFAAAKEVELFLAMGQQSGLRVADVVGLLANEKGIPSRRIGRITLLDRKCFVGLPREVAESLLRDASANGPLAERGWALVALAELDAEEARPGLERLARSGNDALVRTWAAAALARTSDSAHELIALSDLIQLLPASVRPVKSRWLELLSDPDRELDLARVLDAMKGTSFVDCRNVYTPERMEALGFDYECFGR